MQETKRQKQVGALLLEELSDIFRRLGLNMIDGGLVSLTGVKLTPDLLEARIYLSLFQVKDKAAAMKTITDRGWEIKKELAARVKHQLRRIPTLQYFHDDALEHADHMEALFRKIREERGEEGGAEGKSEGGGDRGAEGGEE
ncbi:MAG TPA: ribosome-binding factor A [Puia sp.]|nr:ribosome-binding factor A [Puia sp.]